MTYRAILQHLRSFYKPENVEGMARFGIVSKKVYGVPTPALRKLARQIGRRNLALNRKAIQAAERIRAAGSRAGRWIAADALRELQSEAVQNRLRAGPSL